MTRKENNKIIISFAILFFLFTCINVVTAQSTSKIVDELVTKLQNKVLLTEKQANDIKLSLNDYFNSPSEEKRTSLQDKVESVLNEKQKMKYDIIEEDWWKNIQQELDKVKRNN